MKFRKLIAFFLVFIILLSAAACTKVKETPSTGVAETTPEATPTEPVTITVWHQYMPEVQNALETAYKDFTAETGIKVEFLKLEDFDNKVQNASQTGELPDIIMRGHDWVGKLALMGAIQPVNDIVDKAALDGLIENAVQGFEYKGQLYGVPISLETVALIYNKDLIQTVPKNTDELLAKAKELTKDGQYGFLIPPKDAYFNSAFFYGAGGGYLDNEGNPTLNTPQNAEAGKILAALSEYYPKDLDHAMVSQLFKDGKAAMMVNGPWEIAGIKESKVNYGIARIPGITSTNLASPFMGIQGMYLTTNTKNKEAAGKVMSFLAGAKASKAFALAGGYIPANKEVRNDSEIIANSDIAGFMDQTSVGIPMSNVPEMGAMWTPLDGLMQEMIILKQNVENTLEKYQKTAEEAISNMK